MAMTFARHGKYFNKRVLSLLQWSSKHHEVIQKLSHHEDKDGVAFPATITL
jgi:hypothetical protein